MSPMPIVSLTNLSSLVLLVRLNKKSLLLCGDARADNILEGLATAGAPASPDEQPGSTWRAVAQRPEPERCNVGD
jgi:hypothetical protein